jgi:hypothetical protein
VCGWKKVKSSKLKWNQAENGIQIRAKTKKDHKIFLTIATTIIKSCVQVQWYSRQQARSYRVDRQSCNPDSGPDTSSSKCAHKVLWLVAKVCGNTTHSQNQTGQQDLGSQADPPPSHPFLKQTLIYNKLSLCVTHAPMWEWSPSQRSTCYFIFWNTFAYIIFTSWVIR